MTRTAVAVTNGEFALTISPIAEGCLTGKDVHLIVSVRAAGGGAFTVLGKQRVTPVVGAMTSGAGDFNTGTRLIAASAAIGGDVGVGGALSAPTATFSSATINSASFNNGAFTLNSNPVGFPWLVFAEGDGHLVFSVFGAANRRVSFHGNESGTIRSAGSIPTSPKPSPPPATSKPPTSSAPTPTTPNASSAAAQAPTVSSASSPTAPAPSSSTRARRSLRARSTASRWCSQGVCP